jgi:hypothetical protein
MDASISSIAVHRELLVSGDVRDVELSSIHRSSGHCRTAGRRYRTVEKETGRREATRYFQESTPLFFTASFDNFIVVFLITHT